MRSRFLTYLKRAGVWLAALGVSLILGWVTELFLSEPARLEAVGFQQSLLAALDRFSPENIFAYMGEAKSDASIHADQHDHDGHFLKDDLVRFLAFFAGSLIGQILSGSEVPDRIVYTLAISPIVVLPLIYLPSLTGEGTLIGRAMRFLRGRMIAKGFLFIFVVPTVLVIGCSLIAVILWILKLVGLAMLTLFGWLTDLAAAFALLGTVSTAGYFVVVKGLEKRVAEILERAGRLRIRTRV